MNKLPIARSNDVIVQQSDKEVLIYDLLTNKAYVLNETSAIVYQACHGNTSFDELKSYANFTGDIIFLALDDLRKEKLIEGGQRIMLPDYQDVKPSAKSDSLP